MNRHASFNRFYRLVWSRHTESWHVVSEITRAQGKGGRRARGAVAGVLASVALGGAGIQAYAQQAPPPVNALPTGGVVAQGVATISQSVTAQAAAMAVNQASQRAVVNWNTFNIGQNASVTFNQPNAQAVILNRIADQNPSQIYGQLRANGQVYLTNPGGIYFSPTAQVDVGALVATTHAIGDAAFMNGNIAFSRHGATGSILNEGQLNAQLGGYVALLAPEVRNGGVIVAQAGTVALAAGEVITLNFNGRGGLAGLTVTPATLETLIENRQAVRAPGGLVLISAQSLASLQSGVINNSGTIEATRMTTADGVIRLEASQAVVQTGTLRAPTLAAQTNNMIDAGTWDASAAGNGTTNGGSIRIEVTGGIEQTQAAVMNADGAQGGAIRIEAQGSTYLSGRMSANGTADKGGEIAITAPSVAVAGATVSADGETGGGRVRIGGGWQGRDGDLANASTTTLSGGTISANATQSGDGGTVVVWSDQQTQFASSVQATGGAMGGNGGQVEISSHETLQQAGTIDVSAPRGNDGTVLFDPKNIQIVSALASGTTALTLVDTVAANRQLGSKSITELVNGSTSLNRVMVISNTDSTVASNGGSIRIFDTTTGALVSSLTANAANDQVGSGTVLDLGNGNYVVTSPLWGGGSSATAKGAVTWFNGLTGLSGVVGSSNSLVGGTTGDRVGLSASALTNGNYVIRSNAWGSGNGSTSTSKGAVTWASGTAGITGVVSSDNSLVGTAAGDAVGNSALVALNNGNFVIGSSSWGGGGLAANAKGAITWGSGTAGITGVVSSTNSLVGSAAGDGVGNFGVTALSNGNYVVNSSVWGSGNGTTFSKGAVTWGSGTGGITGVVSSTNSLVGSVLGDYVGGQGVTALTNGNYIVRSSAWSSSKGAVTWGSGTSGLTGLVTSTNSLIGAANNDKVGSSAVALTNGNYVVLSPYWGSGTGNYGVAKGAITWGNGTTGVTGVVSSTNSLVGGTAGDALGYNGGYGGATAYALNNGNYVVLSPVWDSGNATYNTAKGAVTWGSGTAAITGVLSSSNSLVGGTAGDAVGFTSSGVNAAFFALTNGNYVINSLRWGGSKGAVTWGSGTAGITGVVSSSNSLVGGDTGDYVGTPPSGVGVTALSNGNYVVISPYWGSGSTPSATTAKGAVTWASGTSGIAGTISSSNSLIGGAAGDQVGYGGVTELSNGNYVIRTETWGKGAGTFANALGAVTWSSGTSGIVGIVSSANSLVGSAAGDDVGRPGSGSGVVALTNGNYVVSSGYWGSGTVNSLASALGAVTWGSGTAGVSGVVSSSNSLVGGSAGDDVGRTGVTALATGNYLVRSAFWGSGTTNSSATALGAVTWGSGTGGVTGVVSSSNSLVGTTAGDRVGSGSAIALLDGRGVVASPFWTQPAAGGSGAVTAAGRVDIISGGGGDPVTATVAFNTNPSSTSYLLTGDITSLLNAGTAVTLQANNDITVAAPVTSVPGAGTSGAFTLQAGRSVLLNANISLTNASLNVIGNEWVTAVGGVGGGVIDAQRDAGNAVITQAAGTSLNAGSGAVSLILRSAGNTGKTNDTTGAITLQSVAGGNVSVLNNGTTAGSNVTLGTVNATGDLTAVSNGALNLGTSTVGGALSATSNNGNITQSGALTVTGTSAFNAGTGSITLTSAGNDFTGAVSATGATVTITDTSALAFGTVTTTGNFTATSTGALDLGTATVGGNLGATSNNGNITQTSTLRVTGTSALNAGTGNVTLMNGSNDYTGAVSATGANVSIREANALIFGTVNATGNFVAVNTGALDLGTATVGGNLSAISNDGSIAQTGALTVAGRSTVNAGSGDITLTNASNDFTGAVTAAGATVNIRDGNALTLGTVTATGNLTATANGNVAQTGTLTVGGTTTLDAGTGNVTLTSATNDFAGAVSATGATVSITDVNALTLGTVTATGNLTATANGNVTQTGTLTIGGTTTLDAGTGNVTLTSATNDFTGAVSATGATVSITDVSALTLGTVNATGNLTTTNTGALNLGTATVGGALSATSNNGNITQSGALTVTGTSALNAGTGNLTLTAASNDFTGAVSATGATVSITDISALTLGTVNATGNLTTTNTGALNLGTATVGGNLSATSNNGNITQSGALTVTGTSALNAGAGNVTLTAASNDFTGAVSATGATIAITDVSALTLGTVNATGNLTTTNTGALNLGTATVGGALSATSNNGNITQSGALTVTGTSALNAGTGSVALNNGGNALQGTVTTTAGSVLITGQGLTAPAGLNSTMSGTDASPQQPRVAGTARQAATVTLYEGATILGTVTADGAGSWSYRLPPLTAGTHAITVTQTINGETSAFSNALSVTVAAADAGGGSTATTQNTTTDASTLLSSLTPSQNAASTMPVTYSAQQFTALSPSQLAALSGPQLAALTPAQLAALTPAQLSVLSTQQVAALAAAQIAALSDAQLQALAQVQGGALSPAQRAALGPAQLALVNAPAGMDATQLASLTPSQIAELSTSQLQSLTPSQIATLSGAQLNALAAPQLASLSSQQIAALRPEQLATMAPANLAALSIGGVALLSPGQLAALSPAQLTSLTKAQVAALFSSQIASLAAPQVEALLMSGLLTPAQVQSLSVASLNGLGINLIAALSPDVIANFSLAQIAALTDLQMAALTPGQLQALSAAQVYALSPAQMRALSAEQRLALNLPGAPASVTATVTAVPAGDGAGAAATPGIQLPLAVADIRALTPQQVAALTDAQIRTLTSEQLRTFTAEQLAALGQVQIRALDAFQIQALLPRQLTGFSRQQMEALNPVQFGAMSQTQLTTLLLAVETNLTPAQKEAISNVLTTTVSVSDTLAAGSGAGALPVAALGVAIRGAAVRFEQNGSSIRLQMAEAGGTVSSVDPERLGGDYLPLVVSGEQNTPVEFSVALIEGRVVIAARNAAARALLMSDMPFVMASAVTMLSTTKPIVLAELSGLVLDLR